VGVTAEMNLITAVVFVSGAVLGLAAALVFFSRVTKRWQTRAVTAETLSAEHRRQSDGLREETGRLREELDRERQRKTEALTRYDEAWRNLEEQKRLVETMKSELTDTFRSLSMTALKTSTDEFLKLASENVGKLVEGAKGTISEHQSAIEGAVKPLHETLARYEGQIKKMEDDRLRTFGSLGEQLRTLVTTGENLKKETANLVTALRRPQVRGRWGEMQLRRVAELSGMSAYCDFTEQVPVTTDEGLLRPDMVVHLPSEREIIVDSKVSLEAYLQSLETDGDQRQQHLEHHARQIRAHLTALSSKEYWNQFPRSPEFVVLFIPGESFLAAALDIDLSLLEDGIRKRVIIATPTTFIALLQAVAYGWQQDRLTQNAREISLLGKELFERMSVIARHLDELGGTIRKSTETFNRLVGSFESRVLPSVRRFKELGISTAAEITETGEVTLSPRSVDIPDKTKET